MDRSVEAEPVLGAGERLAQAILEPGILDDGVGQLFHHRAVELRIGREVNARAAVVRLEVDDAHAVELAEPSEQLAVPVLLRIELELEPRRDLEPAPRRRAGGDDEPDGTLLAPERLAEAELVLAQPEIEHCTLERPAAIALGQLLELVEMAREILEAPRPREHELGRNAVVQLGLVGDVFPLAGRAVTLEDDRGRHARPAGRRGRFPPLEPVAVDLDRQSREGFPERHTPSI